MVVDRPDSDEMIDILVRTSLSNTTTTTTTTSDDDDDDDNSSTSDNTTSNETVTQPSTASSISSFCQNISTHSTSSNLTRILIRPINLTQELNISTISLTYTTDSVIINQLLDQLVLGVIRVVSNVTKQLDHTHSEQLSNLSVALTVKFEPILDQDNSETDDYNELQLFKFSYQNIINCSTKPTDPRHCLNDPIIFKFSAITSTHPTRSKTFNLIAPRPIDSQFIDPHEQLEFWVNPPVSAEHEPQRGSSVVKHRNKP
ncbi:hypothetical protein BY996DRAFT_6521581 [Phakopsora pachyrhizi]|nr:hypothetical protein BY996DRAFT_6521581 [Phakopsora pachyrhizi]